MMRTTPLVRVPIRTRHRHEVELDRQVDRAGEIGHEHARALEDAHEQRRVRRVIGREVLAQLADALLELFFVDDDASDVGIVHGQLRTVRRSSRGIDGCAR
jgi:hypothetical protein